MCPRIDALRKEAARHLKGEICRDPDRRELLLAQITAAEAERGALIAPETTEPQ